MALARSQEKYSLADYLAWNEGEHWEIIAGEAYQMAAPSRRHQEVTGELFRQLANFLEGKKCRVFVAPFAVRLFARQNETAEGTDIVVEPDISVVCDEQKLDDIGCQGAPDMIIEVMSPASRRYDRLTKLGLYQEAGVREYWIVDSEGDTALIFTLNRDGYLVLVDDCDAKDVAKVRVLEGCVIELKKVFGR